MKHPLIAFAERTPGLRRVVRTAVDALAPVLDPRGVLVLRVSAEFTPSQADIRRILVNLESQGAVSPSWLALARLQSTPWPAEAPTVLLTLDQPSRALLDDVLSVTTELGWSPLVFAPVDSELVAAAPEWTGQGVVLAPLWTGDGKPPTEAALSELRSSFAAKCGYAPAHIAFSASADPEWTSRAARRAGFAAAFGTRPGLAGGMYEHTLQPRVQWTRVLTGAEATAWVTRDRDALAKVELGRWIARVRT